MRRSLKDYWSRLTKRIKYKYFGYRYCGRCRQFAKIRWVKIPVVFEDEPPMLFYWECVNCFARTNIQPTILLVQAAEKIGISIEEAIERLWDKEEKIKYEK